MPRTWNSQTQGATFAEILTAGDSIRGFSIGCDSGSAAALLVRVQNENENIHGDTESYAIAAGGSKSFYASAENPITSVQVSGSGGTATYSGTVDLV